MCVRRRLRSPDVSTHLKYRQEYKMPLNMKYRITGNLIQYCNIVQYCKFYQIGLFPFTETIAVHNELKIDI